MAIRTLTDLFQVVVAHDKPACLMQKVDGRYAPISTADFAAGVRKLAKALVTAGVRRGDRIALMAENGPHWPTVDFATLAVGAALVPIYPTLLPEGAAYVARDSGARILFVQGRERLEGMLGVRADMPAIEKIVLIGGEVREPEVEGYDAFLAMGSGVGREEFDAWCGLAQPEDLATLIYTSGTTGDPKGVMLTHGNLASNVETSSTVLPIQSTWTALSFLPLSHSFERTVDYIYFLTGVTIAYAESIQAVPQNLQEVRPQVFVGVPRLYEKVMARAFENAATAGGLKAKLFRWAVEAGRKAVPRRLKGESPGAKVRFYDKLVFAKLKARLGGRYVVAISGGAPLGRDVAEFFWGAGLPILEGYGLTETSPVLSVNSFDAVKLGTVGKPIPGIEIRIAEDGEILARGPNIMRGYYGKPEATSEAIDHEGWFHTGDIGHVDEDGFLVITDRKKELIVNAYGKNIAPAPIENSLKASRYVSQAVVVGDRRQYLAALLVPDFEALEPWMASRRVTGTIEEKLAHSSVRELFQHEVDHVNQALARYEQIRVWELLPREFTLEGGELTPTLKVKRRVIQTKYKAALDRLYAAGDNG